MAKKRARADRETPPNRHMLAKLPAGEDRKSDTPGHGPVIVGVGASAGGLEAFSEVLRHLPLQTGLALVLVQHLAPQHESSLASLLATFTKLPVIQLLADTPVAGDHIYVIPPNRSLMLRGRELVLGPRPLDRTQYTPVDTFFQSLAKELGSDAIGVILSGTGSDGVEGLQAITAVGGMVLVQDPDTAKQNGMPSAAVATGKVDLVLGPGELAKELARLAKEHGDHAAPRRAGEPLALTAQHLERIFAVLRAATGVDFSQYKLPTVQRRTQRRIALHKVASVEEYLQLLQDKPDEARLLYEDILIHVTRFFREPESFDVLCKEVFPSLLDGRSNESPLRIWVPACSTGEEPYSVAMTLLECLDHRTEGPPVQIFATDISETAIEQARAGVYPPTVVEDLSEERLKRFFAKADGSYRINKTIRDLCVFARQDLTRDPPFSKLDLVVCRNVLIYLGPAVQSRLISVFHYALKSTGYLVLGGAETIGPHTDLFEVADKRHRVYRKKLVETPGDAHFPLAHGASAIKRRPRGPEDLRGGGGNVQGEANRLILDCYAPPGVIVNDDLRIVQFRGHTGRFLEPAPGDASLNLLQMCREGLLHGLRTAIQAAKKKDGPVRREGLRIKTNGDFTNVTLEVVPLTAGEQRHYLILFRETATAMPPPKLKIRRAGAKPSKTAAAELEQEAERLQKELVASREYLQSIIQDLEAANEELQSANEEILSSNEELQSTNEELDTAKEELQSTNEELNTVNEELHGRNVELARINSDLVNVLNGVQIAIVIVSSDLRIRRFTPMAEKVLNLIPGDVGRPIGQIRPNIVFPDLEQRIQHVISNLKDEHREVEDPQGRMYSLTIRPYKNLDNHIDGAVLALFDVDGIRRSEREAREARLYAEAILSAVRHPLVVLDGHLRIRTVNRAFTDLFQIARETAEGRFLFDLDGEAWRGRDLRDALGNALQDIQHLENFELAHDFYGVGSKKLRLSTRRLEGESRPALILLEVEDRTEA